MTVPALSKAELRRENERMRAALRKIRHHVSRVHSGDPATAYYQLGALDAEAAIALGEAIYPDDAPTHRVREGVDNG